MPVPDYQSLMAPTLSVLADGGDHSLAELRTAVANHLALTEDDLRATISSGTPLLANRLQWAITYVLGVRLPAGQRGQYSCVGRRRFGKLYR